MFDPLNKNGRDASAGMNLIDQPLIRAFDCLANSHVLRLHLLRFSAVDFCSSAFAHSRIALPPSIARSQPKRQAEYFYGRIAAREALNSTGWSDVQVGTGHNREPLWPLNIVGAITHNDRYAAASAAHANQINGLGIDIENVVDVQNTNSVEQVALSSAERDLSRKTQDLSYFLALTLIFSAKESFYKATFPTVGKYFGFDAINILEIDTKARHLLFQTQETLCRQWPAGREAKVNFSMLSPKEVLTTFAW